MKRYPFLLFCLFSVGAVFAQEQAPNQDKVWLGVFLGSIQDHSFHLDYEGSGVVVTQVVPDSPAHKAGLKLHDILTKIGDTAVADHAQVVTRLGDFKPGDLVTIQYVRDGHVRTDKITLVARPVQSFSRVQRQAMPQNRRWVAILDESSAYLGIQMDTLNPQLAAYFGVEKGVLIRDVATDSPAQEAGLVAGDVITAWDETTVATSDDIYHLLYNVNPGATVKLSLSRREAKKEIRVVLGSRKGLDEPNRRLMLPRQPRR